MARNHPSLTRGALTRASPFATIECMMFRPAPIALAAALAVLTFSVAGSTKGRKKPVEAEAVPGLHALLLNGGGSARSNYLSHLDHIQEMYGVLVQRGVPRDNIAVFSSDGDAKGKDLVTRAVTPPNADRWLVEGTPLGSSLRPARKNIDTQWPDGPKLRPASYSALREWFKDGRKALPDGSTLLVFVTDHGTRGEDSPENGNISLWNESMSVLEFRALLARLAPGVRVVVVMSQCFSGSFANAIYGLGRAVPEGNVCGFFSTTDERFAYGCYAEGRAREKFGHAFEFIDALRAHASTDAAHREVLLQDDSPDVPLRTSDVFLDHVLQDEALSVDRDLAQRVDELVRAALTHASDYESELRTLDAVAAQFGIDNPRRLTELDEELNKLEALIEQAESTEKLWDKALDDLKRDNVADFLVSKTGTRWAAKLDAAKLKALNDDQRERLGNSFLPVLAKFTRSRPDVRKRLETLRDKAETTSAIRYRMQKREAGALRLRAQLIRIAGIEFMAGLADDDPDRVALEKLRDCEGSVFGAAPGRAKAARVKPLPELADDAEALVAASPSWLGISYKPLEDEGSRGAVSVQRVAPDSPAHRAGLAPKDVVYGAAGKPFTSPHHLREWVMTAPQHTPLPLLVKRAGADVKVDISLEAHPLEVSFRPKPTKEGEQAPALALVDLEGTPIKPEGKPYLLVYWATWCGPCKKSLPEVIAWAAQAGTEVIMVSDEEPAVQKKFLASFKGPMPKLHTVDAQRESFRAHGIRGTPTFILVDAAGVIRHRQTGYGAKDGLKIPGWTWKKGTR